MAGQEVNVTPAHFFERGDVNIDGRVDLADAIYMLSSLFRNGPELSCMKAADSNDNGKIELADAIYLLSYFFTEGPEPAMPFGECGADPTEDDLSCESFSLCL